MPPADLDRSGPPPLRRFASKRLFSLLFGGIWLGVGLLLLVIFGILVIVTNRDPASIPPDRAVTVDGRVVETFIQQPYRGGPKDHPLIVIFSYRGPDGVERSAKSHTYDYTRRPALKPDAPVRVIVDRERPEMATVEGLAPGEASMRFPTWVLALPSIFAAAGLVIFLYGLRGALADRALATRGEVVEAEIVDASENYYTRVGGRPAIDLGYRFEDGAGRAVTGRARTFDPAWRDAKGKRLRVAYDPVRPERNVPLDL